MKSLSIKLIPLAILVLLTALGASAQNTLPDPHNDNCWSSIGALRACQLQATEQAQDNAQRCTSYPEYQCIPDYISLQKQPSAKHAADRVSQKPAMTPAGTVASDLTVNASRQQANAR